jgi:hypothetical protein
MHMTVKLQWFNCIKCTYRVLSAGAYAMEVLNTEYTNIPSVLGEPPWYKQLLTTLGMCT